MKIHTFIKCLFKPPSEFPRSWVNQDLLVSVYKLEFGVVGSHYISTISR